MSKELDDRWSVSSDTIITVSPKFAFCLARCYLTRAAFRRNCIIPAKSEVDRLYKIRSDELLHSELIKYIWSYEPMDIADAIDAKKQIRTMANNIYKVEKKNGRYYVGGCKVRVHSTKRNMLCNYASIVEIVDGIPEDDAEVILD